METLTDEESKELDRYRSILDSAIETGDLTIQDIANERIKELEAKTEDFPDVLARLPRRGRDKH